MTTQTNEDVYQRAANAITKAFEGGAGALAAPQSSVDALNDANATGAGLMREIADSIEIKSRTLFRILQYSHLAPAEQKIAASCLQLANIWLDLPGNESHRQRLTEAMDPFSGNPQEAEMLLPAPAKHAFGMIAESAGILGRQSELKGRMFTSDMSAWERSENRSTLMEKQRRKREDDARQPNVESEE